MSLKKAQLDTHPDATKSLLTNLLTPLVEEENKEKEKKKKQFQKSKKYRKKVVKTRKSVKTEEKLLKQVEGLTNSPKKWLIIDHYLSHKFSNAEIARNFNTSIEALNRLIENHMSDLLQTKEAKCLLASQQGDKTDDEFEKRGLGAIMTAAKYPKTINQPFLDLLSDPEEPTLTESEAIFAWYFVNGGSAPDCLEESGLDAGLIKNSSSKSSYSKACKLRSLFLRRKPNILAFIKDIQLQHLKDLKVDKKYVQDLIIHQIEGLRDCNDLPSRKLLGTNVDRLANSIGAYTTNVNVNQVDPDNALDKLIELAKDAEVKELTND